MTSGISDCLLTSKLHNVTASSEEVNTEKTEEDTVYNKVNRSNMAFIRL